VVIAGGGGGGKDSPAREEDKVPAGQKSVQWSRKNADRKLAEVYTQRKRGQNRTEVAFNKKEGETTREGEKSFPNPTIAEGHGYVKRCLVEDLGIKKIYAGVSSQGKKKNRV